MSKLSNTMPGTTSSGAWLAYTSTNPPPSTLMSSGRVPRAASVNTLEIVVSSAFDPPNTVSPSVSTSKSSNPRLSKLASSNPGSLSNPIPITLLPS